MKIEDIYKKLKTLGLPVAYRCFKDTVAVPYIVYYIAEENIYGADNKNLICERTARIEFYCEIKDYCLEKQIENLFSEFELSKSEIYISDENLIETVYEFSHTFKIQEEL